MFECYKFFVLKSHVTHYMKKVHQRSSKLNQCFQCYNNPIILCVSGFNEMIIKEEIVDPLYFGESFISENDVKDHNAQKQIDPLLIPIKNEVIKDEIESNDETSSIQIPSFSENNELEKQVKIEKCSSIETNQIEAIDNSKNKNTNTKSTGKIHVRNVQEKIIKNTCTICNKSFKVKYHLKRHLNTVHQEI